MLKYMLGTAALATALIIPGVAAAAVGAVVTTDLNIRTGPGTSYQRFDTIPDGSRVTVYGCRRSYNWCDVSWRGHRGWVSGNYLAYRTGRRIPQVGFELNLPIIDFHVGTYHDRHYRGRSWYRGPGRWDRDDDRGDDRADLRRERRDVREARQAVREARQDLRRERRQGGDVRDEQRDLIMAQRELRRELRDLRRANL